jgi:hypothetical protein
MKRLPPLLLACLCACASAAELQVPVPGRGHVVLDLPDGWQHQLHPASAGQAQTMVLTPRQGHGFLVSMAINPFEPAATHHATSAQLRALVQQAANAEKPKAIEPELRLFDLDSSGKDGVYFSATEKSPDPQGYRFRTQGTLGLNTLSVNFSILSPTESKPLTEQALQLLRSIRQMPAKPDSN